MLAGRVLVAVGWDFNLARCGADIFVEMSHVLLASSSWRRTFREHRVTQLRVFRSVHWGFEAELSRSVDRR